LRKATALFKTQNYSACKSKKNGIQQFKKSLGHSLQILTKDSKNLEWIASEDHKNYIYFDDKIVKMSDLSQDDRIKIQDDIFNKISGQIDVEESSRVELASKTKTIKDLASYRCKINKFGDEFKFIIDIEKRLKTDNRKISDKVKDKILEKLESSGVKRINQKKKTVSKYIDLYNKMIDDKSITAVNKRHTIIQESFFKIPHHNKIGDVPASAYINIIKDFYTKNFSDYNIEMLAFHANEITANTKNTGHHPHIFINCKNSKTNQYDFQKSVTKFVNSHIESSENPLPESGDLTVEQLETRGRILQEIFYKHANTYLNKHDVNIEFKEKTADEMSLRKKIANDSKKNKSQRDFNLSNQLENELKQNEKKLIEQEEKFNLYQQAKANFNGWLQSITRKMFKKAEDYSNKVADNINTSDVLDDEINTISNLEEDYQVPNNAKITNKIKKRPKMG
jgi:hypothetical protein